MGLIWNVVLSFGNEEWWEGDEDQPRETCEPLERINAWIPDGKLVDLVGPTYADDAGSGLDANLYGGGFKHFDIDAFIKVVEAQAWKDRPQVQLWIKGQVEGLDDGSGFEAVPLRPRPRVRSVKAKGRPTARGKPSASAARKRKR